MDGDIIPLGTVGLGLAALMIGLFAWLRQDMKQLRAEIHQSEERLQSQIHSLRGDVAEVRTEGAHLRERMAKLEGLLEGLREAITRSVPG